MNTSNPEMWGDTRDVTGGVLEEFLHTKFAKGCSKGTIYTYRSALQSFMKYVDNHYDEVTTEDIQEYLLLGLTERKWSLTTWDNVRRILNTFYVWASRRKYVSFNPVSAIPWLYKKPRVKKQFVNLQQTPNGHWRIVKMINGERGTYGTYRTLEDAMHERDYLESIGWDYDNMD